jgi:hypothetical protein
MKQDEGVDVQVLPGLYLRVESPAIGSARACPLPIDSDPDLQDYTNEGDQVVVEVGNA